MLAALELSLHTESLYAQDATGNYTGTILCHYHEHSGNGALETCGDFPSSFLANTLPLRNLEKVRSHVERATILEDGLHPLDTNLPPQHAGHYVSFSNRVVHVV